MLHQQHADAGLAHGADHLGQMLDLLAGEAAGRLVEQEEARLHDQPARDFQEALFGMVEEIGAALDHVAQAHAVQDLGGTRTQGLVFATDPRQAECRREEAGARVRPGAERGVVEHRERRQEARLLEGAGDADAGAPLHRRTRQFLALAADRAGAGLVEAREHVEQRRLAAAVRADQAVHLARAQGERYLVERADAAEVLADADGFERARTAGGMGLAGCVDRGHRCGSHDARTHGRTSRAGPAARARASRDRSGVIAMCRSARGRKRSPIRSNTRPMPSGTINTTASSKKP